MSLASRIKNALPPIFALKQPVAPHTGAYQVIVEKEQAEGRELSVQEIQDLTGWDNAQMATAVPGLAMARNIWGAYLRDLEEYQRKLAKREARQQRAQARPKEAPISQPAGVDIIPGEARTLEERVSPRGRSFSDLTADELSIRRREILANTPFDLPFHRKFMNWLKDTWRVIGPPSFVVFTVWEVFYFMNHFMKATNVLDFVLLWGISLIIEIPFMIATYDQSERRERAAELRARGRPDTLPGQKSSLIFWCCLAAVNIVGQMSFLAFITHAGMSLTDPNTIGLWLFIVFRVTGVIVGDCYTAFHLLPTEANIDRVLRTQQAQMEGEQRLAASDAERLRKDAESKQAVRRVELSVKREEREVNFMEEWQQMNMRQTLARQQRFMELENRQLRQLLPEEKEPPDTGDL